MKVLIVSATNFEVQPLYNQLFEHSKEKLPLQLGEVTVHFFVAGVGLMPTAFTLGKHLTLEQYDLVIQAGIAGSYRRDWELGKVVHVVAERAADVGVEEADGRFTDVFELELTDPNEVPYQKGWLHQPDAASFQFLPQAKGLSVNKVSGTEKSIEQISANYPADIENMEGAAFFYACLLSQQPFLSIRSISNYVEVRNRANWNLPLAIQNLNNTLFELLKNLR